MDALQFMNDKDSIAKEDAAGMYIAPPYPEGEEQFLKERWASEQEMVNPESITDPLPPMRVMFSNVLLRVQLRESEVPLWISGSF